ncbi:sigma factor-like helix-turn-helix DNA-binding protein [Pseudarthrobacter sp. P1]|uniref:sigma factor-like helix-turn-helix DNA-binding protein n=1 Tax=Pseudarthrobacter sp. P1 TaxID=3418418 RepID=UPI003CF62D6C
MRITAQAERDGKFWVVTVPEVKGAFTQARRLNEVEEMARSVVADLLEIDGSSIEVVLEVELSPAEQAIVAEAQGKLATAEEASKVAAEANQRAVSQLRGDGYTTREVAAILGISAGRVNQIETKGKKKGSERRLVSH